MSAAIALPFPHVITTREPEFDNRRGQAKRQSRSVTIADRGPALDLPLCSGDRHLALAVGGVPNWPICIVAAAGVST
jgi:hypothetical protein